MLANWFCRSKIDLSLLHSDLYILVTFELVMIKELSELPFSKPFSKSKVKIVNHLINRCDK